MTKRRKDTEEFRFEEALNRLEEITRSLESGELSLDESLAAYEEGIKLRNLCTDYLGQAEKRLQMLQKKDGELRPVDVEEEEASLF
jgi:exodeoxyribonuclease VII small subunit